MSIYVYTMDYRFKEDEYKRLYTLCGSEKLEKITSFFDNIPEEIKRRFGPSTLCPDVKFGLPSPLGEAAHNGRLDVVKYLLENYGDIIDVNEGAKFCRKKEYFLQKERLGVPPMVAACTNNNVELVQYLISKGGDIHKPAYRWGTPLSIAARYACNDVITYLLDLGADIEYTDEQGYTPFLMACGNLRHDLTTISLLLSRGVNRDQKTMQGYSAMHVAAIDGNWKMLQLLVNEDFPSYNSEADPFNDDYVPPPAHLSATNKKIHAADYLTYVPKCSDVCKGEAYICLVDNSFDEVGIWRRGIQIMNESPEEPKYPPPLADYGYRKEMATVEELNEFQHDDHFEEEFYLQLAMIRERCLGFNDPTIAYFIAQQGQAVWKKHQNKEIAEMLWSRALKLVTMKADWIERHALTDHVGFADELARSAFSALGACQAGVVRMMQLVPCYPYALKVFEYAATIFDFCLKLPITTKILEDLFERVVRAMSLAALCSKKITSMNTIPIPIQETARKVIAWPVYPRIGTTLLYRFIDKLTSNSNLDYETLGYVLEFLLEAGCYKDVNVVCKITGYRPLHCAALMRDDLYHYLKKHTAECLLAYGAHLDAVDAYDNTPLELCNRRTNNIYSNLHAHYPLPLSCCSARAIIDDCLQYQLMDLPKHIIEYIALHDGDVIEANLYFHRW